MYSDPYKDIYPAIELALRDLVSEDDAYHKTHLRRIARTLQVFLDQKPKGKVLEVGTGGIVPLALKSLAPELEVVVTNFNKSTIKTHTYSPTINGISGDFEAFNLDLEYDNVPVEDNTFDWILCCEVIEHMEIDPMFMMSELNRVAKYKAGLLITTPNIVSSQALTKMMYGLEPHFYMQYHPTREYNRHNYEYSIHSLMQVIKAAGFDGSIWTEDNFEDGMTDVPNRLRSAGFNIQHIGDNIMTVAHKVSEVVDRHPKAIYDISGVWKK
jgi:2-polyprenyl-3-methyl-5-hydroxy-6-metoxy-1,4-benzoquinol methylase